MHRIAVFSLFILTLHAQAATYVVSRNGRDSNPGSEGHPFRTIARGVSQLKAGDTLTVGAGTYSERVVVWDKHGRQDAPIRIVAAPGTRPVIEGRGVSVENALVAIGRSEWVHFEGFEVRDSSAAGVILYGARQTRVRWNLVHDCSGAGIHAAGTGLLIEGNTVTNTVLENSSASAKRWSQALACEDSTGVSIIRNHVFRNFGEGIDVIRSSRVTVARNHLSDNFSANVYLDNAQYATVDANFIRDSGTARFQRGGEPPFGIALANETYSRQLPLNHLTITNNVILRTRAGIYYYDGEHGGGLHHTAISQNTLYGFTWAAIVLGHESRPAGHDTTFVTNNIVLQRSGKNFVSGFVRGVVFRGNAWWGGNAASAVSGPGDLRVDPLVTRAGGSNAEDFALRPESPCRDAVRSGPRVRTDYAGRARPRGAASDLGAFEL